MTTTTKKPLDPAERRKINREGQRELRRKRKETHADMRIFLLRQAKGRLEILAKHAKLNQTEMLETLINTAFEEAGFEDPE
jgi:hypothetical protein